MAVTKETLERGMTGTSHEDPCTFISR